MKINLEWQKTDQCFPGAGGIGVGREDYKERENQLEVLDMSIIFIVRIVCS